MTAFARTCNVQLKVIYEIISRLPAETQPALSNRLTRLIEDENRDSEWLEALKDLGEDCTEQAEKLLD